MTISIVLPTFNRAEWLPGAIGSVLAQTCEDWELVIVDDGSTDDTPAVIAQFTDPRIRVLTQANKGQTWATRAGVEATNYPYVALLSSDDELTPNALADYIPVMGGGADVAYGDYLIEWEHSIFGGTAGERRMHHVANFDVLPARNVVAGSCFRRSVYDAIGGWSKHWVLANDWAFYLAAFASGYTFVRMPITTYVYRYHIGGQTFQRRKLQLDEVEDIKARHSAGLLDARTPDGYAFLHGD